MNEVAVTEPTTSSPKRDQVLAALAAGKSTAEAATEAGCSIPYAQVVAREQKASVTISVGPNDAAELEAALKDSPSSEGIQVVNVASPHIRRAGVDEIAELIWPYTMERVGGRYRIGDEAFEQAAKNALEAAGCFLVKARGHSAELVRLALVIWPALWRDYGTRGRYIVNISVSTESAAMAMSAAEKYLAHA